LLPEIQAPVFVAAAKRAAVFKLIMSIYVSSKRSASPLCHKGEADLLEETYIDIINLKTAALFAAALPKTTRSIKEFDPNLLAPCTETHDASPIAINPVTVFSAPFTVRTSPL
jgi:hypothetical protein